jgi:hypothetical protein
LKTQCNNSAFCSNLNYKAKANRIG